MHTIFDERRYLIPFRSILLPQIFTDTLVIGSGAAGLSAAEAASAHGDVIVLAKGAIDRSNTSWAQGGIAGVLASDDSVDAHVDDTMRAGAGLCDEPVVRSVIERSTAALERVIDLGFRVDRVEDGTIELAREGGHSFRRIIHADGDATGAELSRVLSQRIRSLERVRVFDRCFALDLLTPGTDPGSPCLGAITWHPKYGLQMIWARATILASGGAGAVWRETTNPPEATADGIALAYRAGARVADLAFMQFHPTALYIAGASRTLISEAVRGEGATLVDDAGQRFMQGVHELAELAPRDVVSAGISAHCAARGLTHVWLECRGIPGFEARFPSIARTLASFDLDPARDLIPVNPAAHYMVGGVRTDTQGRTSVPGLYAVGECACTGLHGANRLASNSLLEALVIGQGAGEAAQEMTSPANAWGVTPPNGPVRVISDIPISDHGELDLADVRSSLRSAMWRNVGVSRDGGKLDDAVDMLGFWARYTLDKIFDEPAGWEVQNMLLTGALVARSAGWREESRGCHRRTDHPEPSEVPEHDFWVRGEGEPQRIACVTSLAGA
ncbi:MAG: L-aspartate oxidase [Phycisphaerales bacterium]